MSDDAPLIFEKVLGTLRPANGAARDALAAIDGRVVAKFTKMTRNQRRRAWYWVMLDVVAEVLTDSTGTPWDAETLHDDVRERLGLGDWLETTSGRRVFKPRSTSDRAMSEADRAKWTDRVARYFSKAIGVEMHTCRRFPEPARHTALTFGHHEIVVDLEPAEAEAFLAKAERQRMTVPALKAEVRVSTNRQTTILEDDDPEDREYRSMVQAWNRCSSIAARRMFMEAIEEVGAEGEIEL